MNVSEGSPERLGEWCVRKGLATPEEIEDCARLQSRVPGTPLGEVLVSRGILTQHQVREALASQNKQIRTCSQCGIQVNVPLRSGAVDFRCVRCRGPLAVPSVPPKAAPVEEDFILVSRDPVSAEVQAALQDPRRRFGKYALLRVLGQGGIGVVYLAWDTFLGQYVALKRLRPAHHAGPSETPREFVQSLLKEARSAIRLRHPGIVSVFDVGRIGREYYVAMEYLEGQTLEQLIIAAKAKSLPSPFYERPRETLAQLVGIARAVDYAHRRPHPIVHCDLKPANILVDPEGHAHVLDFGLARNLKLDIPEQGEISGTPAYMAPEQASGETDKIDGRTDVYAFGAMLYELLTGRPPFVGMTLEVLQMTVETMPVRPSDMLRLTRKAAPDGDLSTREILLIPPALEELCLACLSKAREERPPSLAEVADRLEAAGRPVAEPAVPRPARPAPTPWLRRAILGTAAAAALLTVGLVLTLGADLPDAGAAFAERETYVRGRIGEFRPDLAVAEARRLRDACAGGSFEERASRLLEEASWVDRLHRRAVASGLCAPPPADPAALIDALQSALSAPDEGDRLALALLSLRRGLPGSDARFRSLLDTPLAPIAQRYLVSFGQR